MAFYQKKQYFFTMCIALLSGDAKWLRRVGQSGWVGDRSAF